jgi:cytochrome c oxidase cbb3-type subunit 2
VNKLTTLFAGIFGCFAFAWVGLVFIPNEQFGHLEPVVLEDTGDSVPKADSGLVTRGRQVYAAYGCVYCHTQQIRPVDVEDGHNRGWGARRTVARDYINERPPFLGTMRTGPDLTNIGHRQPSDEWHHKHLYMPWAVTPGSIMPSFSFLYETRKITGQPSPDAVKLDPPYAAAPGYEIVPTADAKALVAYLKSLDRTYPLTEAPEKQ